MGHVPATVIVGAQWGDEGKWKIVDLLAQESDLVCRYQGGPNAGHTIVVEGETYKIRAIPSGIVAGVASAIGAGCVVDPEVLIGELDELEERGQLNGRARLRLGQCAPHHAVARRPRRCTGAPPREPADRHDAPRDRACVRGQGDTHRIRVQDLLDPKILREKAAVLAAGEKNVWLDRVYGIEPFDVEDVVARTLIHAEGSRRTLQTRRCSSTARCGTDGACCSRACRACCSTSTT